jgi:putative tryptophan/tyrosine transport system substrate-binding protein
MKRRTFISLLGGAAGWPVTVRAQQSGRVRRIGVLMGGAKTEAQQVRMNAFRQGLRARGWSEGANVVIDERWSGSDSERMRKDAKDLVALMPDVIFASPVRPVEALLQQTSSIPVVFVASSDPVAQGLVASMARPGGQVTGFSLYEFSLIGKQLEALKQVAPGLKRVALVSDVDGAATPFYLRGFEAAAPALAVQPVSATIRNDKADIERVLGTFGRMPNGGLLLPPDITSGANVDLIIEMAARLRLPAIWSDRLTVARGGLISYGVDQGDLFLRAASYVDRILKGEKAAELPVQAPVKFELVVNLKTAKTLGLTIPESFLLRADEVIE